MYYPSASSTSRNLNNTFNITYGGGETVDGEKYTEVVTIAGLTVRVSCFFPSFMIKSAYMPP